MALIDDYIADLANIQRLYEANWVLPYANAYVVAHTSFKETLQSQADLDKFKLDLFLTAATIGFGAGMGAIFGKAATVASVAVDQALTQVCNRNMQRTFNLMASISASVPGTFIVEQVWAEVSTKIGAAASAQVQAMVTAAPVTAGAVQNPQTLQNDMQLYVLRAVAAAHAVAQDIRDHLTMTANEKDASARAMRAARLFSGAPTRDIIGARQVAADTMELGFYMALVMDADYIEETYNDPDTRVGGRAISERSRVGQVTQLTTAQDYPTWGHGLGVTPDGGIRRIAYDRPGSRIVDRINTLHNAKFRMDFMANGWFDNDMGGRDIARAELTLQALNWLVLARPL
ncbi:hypothetical protein [Cypionkella sp. TWP1-2-1b2]|uniref:hypothetical protein n=1 Tax=Cypionkella sp. TWP1-2-1b2 TaxID=2804675 RepID=UPI003CFAE041